MRFENILEKHIGKEETNREKKETEIISFFKENQTKCQERYDKLFDDVFSRIK
jgi:hypothetical protein